MSPSTTSSPAFGTPNPSPGPKPLPSFGVGSSTAAASGSAPAKTKKKIQWEDEKLPPNLFFPDADAKKKKQEKRQRQKMKKAEEKKKKNNTEQGEPSSAPLENNSGLNKSDSTVSATETPSTEGAASNTDTTTTSIESKPVASAAEINDIDGFVASQPLPWSATNDSTHSGDQQVNVYAVDRKMNTARSNLSDMPAAVDDDLRNDEQKIATDDVSWEEQKLIDMQRELQKQMLTMEKAVEQKLIDMQRDLQKDMTMLEMAVEQKLLNFQGEMKEQMTRLEEEISKKVTGLINYFVSKEFQVMLEDMVRKELADVRLAVVRPTTPAIEKSRATIDLAISDYFQKGDGYESLNQLEKLVDSKHEATVPEQIKAQFQTSCERAPRDGLMCSMKSSVLPAYEKPCKATLEKGVAEYTKASLRKARSSASATQALSGELADDHRKLAALAAGRGNSSAVDPRVSQLTSGFHEKVEMPLDPTKEQSRLLLAEGKYEAGRSSSPPSGKAAVPQNQIMQDWMNLPEGFTRSHLITPSEILNYSSGNTNIEVKVVGKRIYSDL